MTILAKLDCIGGKVRLGLHALDWRAVNAGNAVTVARQLGTVAILQIDDTARYLQQGGRIGSGIASVIGQAKQQRGAFSGCLLYTSRCV